MRFPITKRTQQLLYFQPAQCSVDAVRVPHRVPPGPETLNRALRRWPGSRQSAQAFRGRTIPPRPRGCRPSLKECATRLRAAAGFQQAGKLRQPFPKILKLQFPSDNQPRLVLLACLKLPRSSCGASFRGSLSHAICPVSVRSRGKLAWARPGSRGGKASSGFRKWSFAKPVRTTPPFGKFSQSQFAGFLLRRSASCPSAVASAGWLVRV